MDSHMASEPLLYLYVDSDNLFFALLSNLFFSISISL